MGTLKYIAGPLLGMLLTFSAGAQSQDDFKFNEKQQNGIRSSLDSRYSGVDMRDVEWQLNSEGHFDGDFNYGNRRLRATFDQDGVWTQTTEEVHIADLPEALKDSVVSNYRESEISQINRIETAGNETFFDIGLQGRAPVRYDALGNKLDNEGLEE